VAGKDSKSLRSEPVRVSATPLQALAYAYDGVGNVIALSDSCANAQVSFFRNRAVTPDRGYTYDALYQLTSAKGRENYVNDTPQGTDWPGGGQFSPSATPNYRPYARSYTYDAGGNLTTIRSSNWSGATPPARQLVVDNASNRAVSTANNPGATQANIDTYFDPAGKSICLDANRNQPMYWTAFHQLYCMVTTYRAPTPSTNASTSTGTGTGTGTGDWSNSDREQYAYDGDGQRVRKYASSMAGGNWNSLDTRYLPGLELRGNSASGEHLEVIVLDDGARVLNWVGGTGKPSDIPNLQLRFQYSDRQNSCQIETDKDGNVITQEEYYPYGGTAVLASRTDSEVKYKYIRYSGKERDATGLYYYGLRYYQPWIGRWLNPDPAGTVEGQNLYRMASNSPVTYQDTNGLKSDQEDEISSDGELGDTEGELDDTDGELEDSQGELEAEHLDSGIDWVPILAYWHESPSHPLDRAYDDETTKMVGHGNADLWTRTTTFVTGQWGSESKDRQLTALYEISGAKTKAWDKEIDEMRKMSDFNEAHLSRGRGQDVVRNYRESTEVTIFEATIELVESVVSSLSAPQSQSPIQQAHASSDTRAAHDTALSRRMAYVKDNLLHLRHEAASKDGERWLNVVSKDPQRPEHLFDNWFSNKKIRKDIAFRYQKTRDYFSTDAALHQIVLSKEAGLDLSQITTLQCHNVANLNTLETTSRHLGEFRETRDFQQTALPFLPGFYERRTGDEMRDAFLLTTEVGRSNKRIIDSMNAAGISDDGRQITIDAVWRMDYAPPPIPGIAPISSPVDPADLKTDFFLILKHSPKPPALEPRGRKRPYPQGQP
uniref:RHS repeat-associated core domain-containing protein n=1 Tax=Bordetella sp. LUAb4 TaxID=2843195 RepID=UPI002714E71C